MRRLFLKSVAAGALAMTLPLPLRAQQTDAEKFAPEPVKPGGAILSRVNTYDTAPYIEPHASTIVETRAKTILAAWFGGTKERNPDVCIWVARLQNGKWSPSVEVANGVQADGTRLPTWNPVLFQDPTGDLHLFYKVGPSPSAWWGMVISSADDGKTWTKPRRLPDGILGPIKNKPVVLSDGSWLSPSSTEGGEGMTGDTNVGWRFHFERSTDKGKTWTKTANVPSKVSIEAIQPSVLFHKDGQLQAIGRTRQGVIGSTWSKDNGLTWSSITAIDLPNPSSGTDAVTLKDGRQLVVYNHSGHRPDEPGKGDRWPLNIALSDDGIHWRNVLTLEDKPLVSGYAYPAVIQTSDGLLHITYTVGRRRIRHVVVDPKKLV
ncbi:exo-alpha-sialidase [Asticcacaulis sp. BYS171W]|uniref:Exo-alpha-sialidase n=1 Tax=Asticcacaulis aquaticus TaxID=2984212 RepID=A0ABT5HVN6_9CAUL|nr:sialidase family protein [Asticcacaulis aquaticus]MDC7684146.1 exo-alpha-sialidase [Asticcacaulis aquaticus]